MENTPRIHCHPIFRATSALERGELRSKEKRKKSVHFNTVVEKKELILRTIISVNQLSIHGAAADLRKKKKNTKIQRLQGNFAANEDVESMEIPHRTSYC